MSEASCRITPSTRSTLDREYTALHEGKRPRRIKCDQVTLPDSPRAIGEATEIQYLKEIPGETPDYHHPWKFHAQPTIGIDSEGRLHFKSGRYEVRRRGIEDRVPGGKKGSPYLVTKNVQKERWVSKKPDRLVTLGPLRFLRYRELTESGSKVGSEVKTIRFKMSDAPEIAHDQDGNLHVLGGRYRVLGDTHMRRRRHARHNPTSSRRSSRKSKYDHAVRHGVASFAMAMIGAVSAVVIDAGLGTTTLSPNWRASLKLGGGLLSLIGGSALAPVSRPGSVVLTGLGLGASVDGGLDAYNLWVAPLIAKAMAPAATQPQVTQGATPGATPGAIPGASPGAGAWLPAGAPADYRSYAPQSCAVG